jgi:hypothetical protein
MWDDVQQPSAPGGSDYTGAAPSPAATEQWIAEQQARLDRGLPLNRQGIPPGYKVENGRIVRENWWDQWGKGATIGMGLGIAGGLGAGALNGAMGGGGMAAQNVAPFAGLPSGGAAAGGMTAQNVAPFAGLPGGIGSGGSGAATGAGLGAQTASGFNMRDLLKYIVGGGAVVGGLTGAGQPDMPEGMEDLLGLQKRRLEASNPLYESVLRLAFSRMPTGATQGLSIPSVK